METGDFRGDVDRAIAAGDASGAARMLASAWELEPGSAMAGFVAARYGRIAGSLGLLQQRWAILRSFTVEPVVPVFKAGAYAAHGSMFHRRIGSIGMRQTPGRTWKNQSDRKSTRLNSSHLGISYDV